MAQNTATAAPNTPVVLTFPADPRTVHRLDEINWSYSADPTAGSITIADSSGTIWQLDVTSGGPGFLPFDPHALNAVPGSALIITLAAGGAGVVGKLNAITR